MTGSTADARRNLWSHCSVARRREMDRDHCDGRPDQPLCAHRCDLSQDRYAINEATMGLRQAAGNFYINDKPTGAVVGQQPFGGARASGTNDKAGSILNLLRWVSPRTIKETFAPPHDWAYLLGLIQNLDSPIHQIHWVEQERLMSPPLPGAPKSFDEGTLNGDCLNLAPSGLPTRAFWSSTDHLSNSYRHPGRVDGASQENECTSGLTTPSLCRGTARFSRRHPRYEETRLPRSLSLKPPRTPSPTVSTHCRSGTRIRGMNTSEIVGGLRELSPDIPQNMPSRSRRDRQVRPREAHAASGAAGEIRIQFASGFVASW